MKTCAKCKRLLPESYFNNANVKGYDYLRSDCKYCQYELIKKHKRTKLSVMKSIYSGQKNGYKGKYRKNRPTPKYTFKQFKTWFESQSNFETLYNNWVKSGYDTELKPSVDRINHNLGYVFSNLQLITWLENNVKGHSEKKGNKTMPNVK